MSNTPRLEVSDLPGAGSEETSDTASPARGREMRQSLLGKLRAPPLKHSWDFWHDRQNRNSASLASRGTDTSDASYADRLVHLASISDVKAFWSTFNNFDVSSLPQQDSVHLFHKEVKPVWEDARNLKGGCWTFRLAKEKAPAFWQETCMLAIGEKLQEAVATDRDRFNDEICGVSLSVRFTSCLIQIWNRDAEHTDGIQQMLAVVMENMPPEIKPKDTSYYYKKHSEHAGFNMVSSQGASQHQNQHPGLASSRQDVRHTDTRAQPIPHSPLAQSSAAQSVDTQSQTPPMPTNPTNNNSPGPRMPPKTDSPKVDANNVPSEEVRRGMAPPGFDRSAPVGSGYQQDAEILQDMEDSLGAMKAAMDVVAAKDDERRP